MSLDLLESVRDAYLDESGTQILTSHFLDGCSQQLRQVVHPLSKHAADHVLRELVEADVYDPIRARYLAAGGTKPLISLLSKREWADAVDGFFFTYGRAKADLRLTLTGSSE